jgi:hypothetical protein
VETSGDGTVEVGGNGKEGAAMWSKLPPVQEEEAVRYPQKTSMTKGKEF